MRPQSDPQHPLERLPEEWSRQLSEWGEPRYRGRQVFQWIQARGVTDPAQMTDLPKSLRGRLSEAGLAPIGELHRNLPAADGTRKILVRLADGRDIESVLIPHVSSDADPDADGEEGPERPVTQCVSSQVGCAMACVFCASGLAGLKRHLCAAEIVSQVSLGRAALAPGERLSHVVFMGMGEPLHNYAAVARALRLLTHPDGLAMSPRRITVSTSGLVPQIDRLAEDFGGQVGLAVSLHAVDDALRSRIMPINRKHPLADLVRCLRRYPLPRGRRMTIEYTLIRGVNDDPADAGRLVDLLAGIPFKVNLIPMNPVPDTPLEAPSEAGVEAFRKRLRARRVPTFVRKQRGDDIAAACGQLALGGADAKRRVKVRPPLVV